MAITETDIKIAIVTGLVFGIASLIVRKLAIKVAAKERG